MQQCEALGGRALAVPGDVTDADRMREVVTAAAAAFGGVWVNNAGTSLWGPAAKFGLGGFTDALRQELGVRSRIEICGIYPAFVDTPTPVNSGNYTGRSLRTVPPVVTPSGWRRPSSGWRRARGGRAAWAPCTPLSVPYAVAPESVGRLAARAGRRFFLSAGEPAEPTAGGLFETRPTPAAVLGGWGEPQRSRARLTGAATGLAVVAGAALRRVNRRRYGRSAP